MKKETTKNLWLYLAAALCVISLAVMVFAMRHRRTSQGEFVPPAFEESAVVGTPEVAEELAYMECYQEGMNFRFWCCGNVQQTEKMAVTYFTNSQENEVWMKMRILDEEGAILGETGLLKPGEYVEGVLLSEELEAGTPIELKIMAYEPETYYSAGAVSVHTQIGA